MSGYRDLTGSSGSASERQIDQPMTVSPTSAAELVPEPSTPEWQRLGIERSLSSARARAQQRIDRFVTAAISVIAEYGSIEFPIQAVADRSKMSIRTFYKFFSSKEDLLVAVQQTILATEVVPRLRARCRGETDPIKRLEVFVDGLFELAELGGAVPRVLTTNHNRLADTRPADLDLAMAPQLELVIELIEAAALEGRLTTTLDGKALAQLFHQSVLAAVHSKILGTSGGGDIQSRDVWTFCAAAIGASSPC